jgi:hypothetical protein
MSGAVVRVFRRVARVVDESAAMVANEVTASERSSTARVRLTEGARPTKLNAFDWNRSHRLAVRIARRCSRASSAISGVAQLARHRI